MDTNHLVGLNTSVAAALLISAPGQTQNTLCLLAVIFGGGMHSQRMLLETAAIVPRGPALVVALTADGAPYVQVVRGR